MGPRRIRARTAICWMVRLFLACFLVACAQTDDVFLPGEGPDATFPFDSGVHFVEAGVLPEAEAGPIYNGGPLACGSCWCDGTLYGCLEGACVPSMMDASVDGASDAATDADADASDAAASCGKYVLCTQIPIECLPKPTCDCIEQHMNVSCAVVPNGNGFALSCP